MKLRTEVILFKLKANIHGLKSLGSLRCAGNSSSLWFAVKLDQGHYGFEHVTFSVVGLHFM